MVFWKVCDETINVYYIIIETSYILAFGNSIEKSENDKKQSLIEFGFGEFWSNINV